MDPSDRTNTFYNMGLNGLDELTGWKLFRRGIFRRNDGHWVIGLQLLKGNLGRDLVHEIVIDGVAFGGLPPRRTFVLQANLDLFYNVATFILVRKTALS